MPAIPLARCIAWATTIALLLGPGVLTNRAAGAQAESTQLNELAFEAYRRAEPLTKWPLKKLLHEIPDLKGLEPAADQSSLPAILARVSDNVKALLSNFVNTTALETIEENRKRIYPPSDDSIVQRFHYLMVLKNEGPTTNLVEYRTDLHGREERPDTPVQDHVKTIGFASMPLYFSTERQPLSDYRYLGTQTVDNRLVRVVAFAEHPEPAAALSGIEVQQGYVPALFQGVAWIDADDYQILRVRTDLLAPVLAIGLARETTEVRFQRVHFPKTPAPLWLPEEVDVTIGLQDGITYTNRHRYSAYEIFNVTTNQQVSPPAQSPKP
jgi:hypothetical protein